MIGLIIAAGKQTRFKSLTPKALCKYGDKTLAEYNINILSKYCDRVLVVVSDYNHKKFEEVLPKDSIINVHVYGLGSGDAILRASRHLLNFNFNDSVFICWGDTILDDEVVSNVIHYYKSTKLGDKILIPVVWEKNPYVQLDGKGVKFSKYGDKVRPGFHDLSMFIGNLYDILVSCSKFEVSFFKLKDGDFIYEHKHGNEFEFLDIFNEDCASYAMYQLLNYKDKSFNTVEELDKLSLHV